MGKRAATVPKPPNVGPYAVRWMAGGKWHRRLTDAGRALVAEHLDRHPWPAAALSSWPAGRKLRSYAVSIGLTQDDIHDVALQAVAEAALTYDPARGTAFNTYANTNIYLRLRSTVSRDRAEDEVRTKLRKVAAIVSHKRRARQAEHDGPAECAERADDCVDLPWLLAELADRDADVVRRRYGLDGYRPHTLTDLAGVYGVSKERCRQIVARSLVRMREVMA